MKNTICLEIKEFDGQLSDYCCVSWSLKCDYMHKNSIKYFTNKRQFPTPYKWDKYSIVKYQNAFVTSTITSKVNEFMSEHFDMEENCSDKAASLVTNMYIRVADFFL
jgi:hypothetical protein